MPKSTFTYMTYIATTADALWKALLDGEFTRQYYGYESVSGRQDDSDREHRRVAAPRAVAALGVVVAASAPRRLVITWADPRDRGRKARHSRVTFNIEAVEGMVRLTVTHEDPKASPGDGTIGA